MLAIESAKRGVRVTWSSPGKARVQPTALQRRRHDQLEGRVPFRLEQRDLMGDGRFEITDASPCASPVRGRSTPTTTEVERASWAPARGAPHRVDQR